MIAAGPAHAAALAALHEAAFPPAEAWPADAFARLLALPGHFARLRQEGFALARSVADEAELLSLCVLPQARRHGHGAALLAAVIAESRHRGATAMFLEVSPRNDAANRLYARAGFVTVGRRVAYYPDGGAALVLRAALSPCAPSAS